MASEVEPISDEEREYWETRGWRGGEHNVAIVPMERLRAERAALTAALSRAERAEKALEILFPEDVEITEGEMKGYFVSADPALNLEGVICHLSKDKNHASLVKTIRDVITRFERARAAPRSTGGVDG